MGVAQSMAPDNREWALVIWLTIALIGVLLSANLRRAFWVLLMALGQRSIVSILALLFAYIALIILGLWHLGWWGIANLKTTLIWAFGSACVAVFNVQKVEGDASFFRRAIGEVISVAVIVEFLTAIDTFPLWVEFFIAGGAFFLAALSATSAQEPSQRLVNRGSNAVLIALGLLMLGKSIFNVTVDFNDFAKMQNVREFLLPIILGLLLLPFLFLLNAYLVAESVSVAFKLQRGVPKLARYAGVKLLRHLGLDMLAWRQWQRYAARFKPSSFAEIEASVLEVQKTRRRQKNTYRVRPVIGWLPEDAIGFLSSQGLKTRPYYRADDREWLAASAMVDLGTGVFPNNVAYYISGDAFKVKELRLKLNVNRPEEQEEATKHFGMLCHELLSKALPFSCTQNQPFEFEVGRVAIVGGHSVGGTLFEWSGGIKGGFDLNFVLAVPEEKFATD